MPLFKRLKLTLLVALSIILSGCDRPHIAFANYEIREHFQANEDAFHALSGALKNLDTDNLPDQWAVSPCSREDVWLQMGVIYNVGEADIPDDLNAELIRMINDLNYFGCMQFQIDGTQARSGYVHGAFRGPYDVSAMLVLHYDDDQLVPDCRGYDPKGIDYWCFEDINDEWSVLWSGINQKILRECVEHRIEIFEEMRSNNQSTSDEMADSIFEECAAEKEQIAIEDPDESWLSWLSGK